MDKEIDRKGQFLIRKGDITSKKKTVKCNKQKSVTLYFLVYKSFCIIYQFWAELKKNIFYISVFLKM